MNKTELLTQLQDIREHYHAAMNHALEEKHEHANADLINGDEVLLPLIEAVKENRLIFKGSAIKIEGQTVGERVKFLRESNGTSQHDLLKAIGRPKEHQAWLARAESGERKFQIGDLRRIAFFYDVLIDDLVPCDA
jgi:hypothetical protein